MHVRRTIPIQHARATRPRRREWACPAGGAGFTIIELMVVILIIVILIAIALPLGAQVLGISRDAATKTTIKKVHEELQKRMHAFNSGYTRDFKRRTGLDWEPANPDHIIDRKREFHNRFWVSLGTNNVVNLDADSSEVLYKVLTEGLGAGATGSEANEFGTLEIGDTDGDGNMEFLDGWGKPLRFYLYPTALFKPAGHNPSDVTSGGANRGQGASIHFGALLPVNGPNGDDLNRDQDDQFGVMFARADTNNDGSLSNNELLQYESNYLQTFSTYHTPLIVSAGPDGEFGLFAPTDYNNRGHLAQPDGSGTDVMEDNITNHNTRTGAD